MSATPSSRDTRLTQSPGNPTLKRSARGRFEVRFAPVFVSPIAEHVISGSALQPRQIKDRTGCFPCKRRKVKCDETLPTCRRCHKRKEVCERPTEMTKAGGTLWRLPDSIVSDRGVQIPNADWQLLDHWFNCGFRILCNLSGTANPFTGSLIEVLSASPAALYTFQSLSAAFQASFEEQKMSRALEQRGKALTYLRKEIVPGRSTETTLLIIVVMGISSGWFAENSSDFGQEHLLAASAVIGDLLFNFNDEIERSSRFYLATGMYMHWDMACSFLAPLKELPVRNPALFKIAQHIDRLRPPHPVLGISTELFLIVGSVGRYCRRVQDDGKQDIVLEAELEKRLLGWDPPNLDPELEEVTTIANCFRFTGLIMLYSIKKSGDHGSSISQWAKFVLQKLKDITRTSPYFGYGCLMLTIISGEITEQADRVLVTSLLGELYDHNRLHVNHQAGELVQAMWTFRDAGNEVSLFQIMDCKGWRLMLG